MNLNKEDNFHNYMTGLVEGLQQCDDFKALSTISAQSESSQLAFRLVIPNSGIPNQTGVYGMKLNSILITKGKCHKRNQ